jgi:hypothetical protein
VPAGVPAAVDVPGKASMSIISPAGMSLSSECERTRARGPLPAPAPAAGRRGASVEDEPGLDCVAYNECGTCWREPLERRM